MVFGLQLVCSLIILMTFLDTSGSVCTFPEDIRGTWYSSEKGSLNFTESIIYGYPINPVPGVTSFDLECQEIVDTVYILQSVASFPIFGSDFYVVLCLDLHPISHYKYWYQLGNDYQLPPTDRYKGIQAGASIGFSDVCTRTTPYNVSTFNTLVKDGGFEDGLTLQTCPTSLLHTFSDSTLTTANNAPLQQSCTDNNVNVCEDDTKMLFTYSSTCSSLLTLSSTGEYTCLMDFTDDDTGVTYLHLWNNDTSLSATDPRIHCYAFTSNGTEVTGTLYPSQCQLIQTNDTVVYPGIKATLYNITETCVATVQSGPQTVYIVAIVFGGIVFILLIVLIVIIVKCRRKLCRRCYRSSKTGHSESTIGSETQSDSSGARTVSYELFVARKAKKLTPIVTPVFVKPAVVDLLYEVIPRPMSSKKKFITNSMYRSRVSLKCN